jgi:hypothetical protein
MAPRLLQKICMDQAQAGRCAIWVDTPTLIAAQELADFTGLDVDTFIQFVVKELHQHEARGGRLRARAQEAGIAPVTPIDGERRRRRQGRSV